MNSIAFLTTLDPGACVLTAGELRAIFLPNLGMLGASLEQHGEELLGRTEHLAGFVQSGRTCGIPFLYPWANRLGATDYDFGGKHVELSANGSIGHDGNGLPMHGIPWSRLVWQVVAAADAFLHAQLDWTSDGRLAVFPFPHQVEMKVSLDANGLVIETQVDANAGADVPISFGFHPYFRIPGLHRAEWNVALPAMKHLELDAKQVPNGQETPVPSFNGRLADRAFDDGYALFDGVARFGVEGNGRRITVEFSEGFRYAQVFAPPTEDFIAFEPMTAPANALISGNGLRIIQAGGSFRSKFRIVVA